MRRLNFILLSGLLFVCPIHASLAILWRRFNEHCEAQRKRHRIQFASEVLKTLSALMMCAEMWRLGQRLDAVEEALQSIDCPTQRE